MNARSATLVIGATGTTGSRVVAGLIAEGHRVKAAGRSATPVEGAEPVRFDWNEPATFDQALDGVDRVYLIPADRLLGPGRGHAALPPPGPIRRRAPRGAAELIGDPRGRSCGGTGPPGPARPVRAVGGAAAVLVHAELRRLHPPRARSIREDGVVLTATGDGRVGFVDAQDIAAVAVRALTDEQAPDTDLILTGPQALSYDDVAAIITEVGGRPVVHRHLTFDQLRDRWAAEIPLEFAALTTPAGMDRAIADGAEDRTSDTVQRLTGRPPGTFRAFAERELS